MKKILFIASQPFFQWRGSPIRVGFDVRALAELGYEVDLLVLPVGEKKDVPGVRVLRAPNLLMVRDVAIGPSAAKASFDAIMFFQAFGLALRNRYDALHCVEDAGAIGVAVAGMTGAKLVFEKHSDPFSYKKGAVRNAIMRMYAGVERFVIRHSDACIGTGMGLVQQIMEVGEGIPVHHVFDIPSSLEEADAAKTAEIRKKFCPQDDEMLVTYVGSFAVYQGIDLIFTAIPDVARKFPKCRFVIIGGDSGEISARTKQMADAGCEKAVSFIGKVPPDALPNYLSASDVLLSPRLAGVNTPLKLLDYLKAGRAIVATDTEANRLILDERIAVLTQPDADSYCAGICRVLGDAALRRMIGQSGRKLIDRVYNYAEFKRVLGECYSELFGCKAVGRTRKRTTDEHG